ncbi:uncharacterized protein LOC113390999 [Ctenocephalides felis]|uniref:uncharacterized protein LOC113390999 n=1 Tax=Ctenocephalides felis TaxID=7515 RepID=UPI000E6E2CFB|nr:uncharacterized protein LOC113390999 [Ctenocephalides felis]
MCTERTKLLAAWEFKQSQQDLSALDEDWLSTLSLDDLRPYRIDRFWRQTRILVAFLLCCLFGALLTAACIRVTMTELTCLSKYLNSTQHSFGPSSSNANLTKIISNLYVI